MSFLFHFATHFLWGQFYNIPLPAAGHFSGQTVIVTGANSGIGLEAARHFAQLGAARVVVACRTVEKAEAAAKDIRESLPKDTQAEILAWDVDLSRFASVQAFCERATKELDRLDVLVENAGISIGYYVEADGYESSITVNVLSTCLMALSLLPLMRRTAIQHNVRPHLDIVSSNAHFFTNFNERKLPEIFPVFKDPKKMTVDRYNVTKLLELLFVRYLTQILDSHNIPITVNAINPGLCKTNIFRSLPAAVQPIINLSFLTIARTPEMGSRTLVAGAAAGIESHGAYMDSGLVETPSGYVLSEDGIKDSKRVYDEVLAILEGIQPGISKNVE